MARILLLTYEFSPFRGGIATVAAGLAAGATRNGHEVHVLAPDYYGDRSASDAERSYVVHRFPGDFCSILSVRKLTGWAVRIRRAMRRLAPELAHAVDPQSQMALTLLARLGQARNFGFTVHGTELLRFRNETMPRLWMRGAFRHPVGTAVVSGAVRDLLLERPDADPDRIAVAHPGIAERWHSGPPGDRATVRAGWNTTEDDVVLITVARRVAEKGQLRTVEALASLPGELRRRTVYIVAGSGPAEYARALVRAAGRGGVRLHLAGQLDDEDLIDAVDAADLFVMLSGRSPKRLEGLGLAFLEAGARGLPSVALDTGGVAEAVLDGRTGIVLSEDAPTEAVSEALARLIGDPGVRTRLGRSAREYAADFTFRRHASETLDPLLSRIAGC